MKINSMSELRRLAGVKSMGDAECPTLLDIEICSEQDDPNFGVKCKIFELDACQGIGKKRTVSVLQPFEIKHCLNVRHVFQQVIASRFVRLQRYMMRGAYVISSMASTITGFDSIGLFPLGSHEDFLVYETPVETAEDLVARVVVAAGEIADTPGVIEHVYQNIILRPVYVIDVYKLTPSNDPKERSRRARDLTVASDNLSAIEFRPGDFFFNVEPVIRNEASHRKIIFRVGILA
ncbi:hypothetical protein ANN_22871 [Periplaneta americana]|uniref:Uncharacterized protein n=1 Tax=Periplaneta americana TaxID=6978 RepID=A0ABQ8SKR6_PERAM|nr:hypothetical protein ANN_22871 [Periplaneta americana]